ncbi:glutaredoxin domain-containing protein [Psychrosphaera haliotis]|uniref:glutaredoxin domain-containing protein n=1 Tax=Psychrosphaera haliotis TaxID=555083 RepID=UPI002ED94D85
MEWCKACSRLKKYLRVKGVPFKNMDVEKSSEALAHYKKLEGDRYPLILFSNVRINGFHKLELDNQLQKLLQQPKS